MMPKILDDSSIGNRITTIAGATAGAYAVAQLYNIGKELYKHNNPSESEKALMDAARQRNELLPIKQKFRNCLMENANLPRNMHGRPMICENFAQNFLSIAGESELEEMTKTFTELYRN